jgi:hypothetical protein
VKVTTAAFAVMVWLAMLSLGQYSKRIYDTAGTVPNANLGKTFAIEAGKDVRYVTLVDAAIYSSPLYVGPLIVAVVIVWGGARLLRRPQSNPRNGNSHPK